MRLNINLATKPYQDVRRLLLQWGSALLVLAVLTVLLVHTAVSRWRESREVAQRSAALRTEIARLNQEHDQAVTLLHQNTDVTDNAHFLNGLIARKAFSWTRVFMQLEEIMPAGLHVVTISPALQPKTNTVEMRLTVAGTSREAAVELVKRLEQSPSFRDARIAEESEIRERNSPDTIRFQLTANYVPQGSAPASATKSLTAENKGEQR